VAAAAETVAKPALQTFGKYQILERIATGGMAEIYKAKLEGIGGFQRTFAIKRILPNLSQNGDYIAMLVDEAKVAGLLSHANIVQILDLGQVDGIWYIAMEYVDGKDLGGVLRRAREKGLTLPVPHTVFIAIELLKGLEYAHERQVMRGGRPVALNIIHRDVSPPNILLSIQGEVKLTDFGIARASLKAMETVSGIVKGRFDYMSPEQAAGAKDLDQRSDLFSVGVVLYEMLTGAHPFRTDNEIGTIERVRTGKYTPVSQINPEVPFTLETIVDRTLQVNRDDRYPSATALKEALDKFFHDAGFIFTHATLASYVKGLFPEAQGRTRSASSAPAQPRTARNISGGLQDDVPTGRLEHRTQPMEHTTRPLGDSQPRGTPPPLSPRTPSPIPIDRSSPVAQQLAPAAVQPEDETLIRSAPTGWEDQIATHVVDNPWKGDDDQETAIKSLGPDGDLLDEPSLPLDPYPSAAPAPATTTSSRSSLGLLGGGLVAVVMLVGGLFGGMALTIVLGLAAGVGMGGGAMAPRGAVVQVVAPAGTSIKLDGDAVGTKFSVPTEGRHRIEIELDGHEPWSEEFSFSHGEYRVLHVEQVELTPSGGR
jgi:serine/threonine protein kinase